MEGEVEGGGASQPALACSLRCQATVERTRSISEYVNDFLESDSVKLLFPAYSIKESFAWKAFAERANKMQCMKERKRVGAYL